MIGTIRVTGWLLLLAATARCSAGTGPSGSDKTTTVRIGVGEVALSSPQAGLNQVISLLSVEGLVNFSEDGRVRPWLAQSWTPSPDGLSLTIQLRPHVRFHDGSPASAPVVAEILQHSLPKAMGQAFNDVDRIVVSDDNHLKILFRRPSPFVLESLETPIETPGATRVATGPYIPAWRRESSPQSVVLSANRNFYLGRPTIDEVDVTAYSSVRAAWAELLRGRLDMLFEVGADALDSLQSSTRVATYTFTRPYQYMLILNTRSKLLRSSEFRRGLNAAIDREALIRDGLSNHGVPSAGPVSPHHWAFDQGAAQFTFDPQLAVKAVDALRPITPQSTGRADIQLTCLAPPDVTYERLALVVKRQLAAVGIDLAVKEATMDQIGQAFASRDFEAVLIDVISGPSLFRPYRWWHSQGAQNLGFSSSTVDEALDRIRHAASDAEYKAGVSAFQRAIAADPPAIFLAWGERARAVSRRFSVPVEPGRDIIATLRSWRMVNDERLADRN